MINTSTIKQQELDLISILKAELQKIESKVKNRGPAETRLSKSLDTQTEILDTYPEYINIIAEWSW